MAEVAFLEAVRAFLDGPAGLSPAPAAVGFAEPVQGDALPLISLSLSEVSRIEVGLGGGAVEISDGALEVTSVIDLADPVLPGPDGFALLDETRRVLTLPHGGQIRADALDEALGPADLSATVDGVPRTLTANDPGATEFAADPLIGRLVFGAALPAAGTLAATYHLGIWERRTTLIEGVLDLAVWGADAAGPTAISGAAMRALVAQAGGGADDALAGLKKISPALLGEIGPAQPAPPNARARRTAFRFEYAHSVDAPASSGGVIGRVPVTSRLAAFSVDADTGALVETIEIEAD